MTETQSRYGIMEELNNRKIKQREKLANIERESDNHVFETEQSILKSKEEIEAMQKSFKLDFMKRQQDRKVNLDMITSDFNRAKTQLEEAMKDDVANYEDRFGDWKSLKAESIQLQEDELKRYREANKKKIEEKNDIITEIENGIASLKEISADQSKE